jgi:CheY-like chemotaxis protein
MRILIVDDQASHRDFLIRMLARDGYQADVAENGLAAVDLVARRSYDLVFMDVQMPELGGADTTRRIRADHGRSVARIVGLSARSSDAARSECLDAGMDAYYAKPLSTEQLEEVLRDAGARSA